MKIVRSTGSVVTDAGSARNWEKKVPGDTVVPSAASNGADHDDRDAR
jgi:hypothetical protein